MAVGSEVDVARYLMTDSKSSVQIEALDAKAVAVVTFTAPSLCEADKVSALGSEIRHFVDEHKPRALVFDFSHVKFFSSQVLGVLLDVRGRIVDAGGRTVICAIEPQLHRVFKITNLDKIFEFFPDRNTAVGELSADSPGAQSSTEQ